MVGAALWKLTVFRFPEETRRIMPWDWVFASRRAGGKSSSTLSGLRALYIVDEEPRRSMVGAGSLERKDRLMRERLGIEASSSGMSCGSVPKSRRGAGAEVSSKDKGVAERSYGLLFRLERSVLDSVGAYDCKGDTRKDGGNSGAREG